MASVLFVDLDHAFAFWVRAPKSKQLAVEPICMNGFAGNPKLSPALRARLLISSLQVSEPFPGVTILALCDETLERAHPRVVSNEQLEPIRVADQIRAALLAFPNVKGAGTDWAREESL
jgi:hypothetical protein